MDITIIRSKDIAVTLSQNEDVNLTVNLLKNLFIEKFGVFLIAGVVTTRTYTYCSPSSALYLGDDLYSEEVS